MMHAGNEMNHIVFVCVGGGGDMSEKEREIEYQCH